ncbi:4Fe-4S dicluster domain-containing protein [Prolixibacteraceae bacterium JC049]|nr:4Fe-4S dicluster domain-containing protein [Prolixibacteraceae bacterium JC049]
MIIYFSGTGNSLKIAQQLAEQTNDTAIHINQAEQSEILMSSSIGFVFPVYNYDIPVLVKNFIKKTDFPKSIFTFGIITHGGDKGNALFNLSTLLKEKDVELTYTNDVLMPVSSRIMYGMVTDKIAERTANAKAKVTHIASELRNRINNQKGGRKKHLLALISHMVESNFLKKRFTPVIDSEICTNCGICIDACPALNITEQSSKAFIGANCVQCMTCIHWCPHVAIHFKSRQVKAKQQYHHPDVKLKELIINKNR